MFHFGTPGFSEKTSVFLRLEWKVPRVNGKYYVSTKGNPVLNAYLHKGVREGEKFTGNFGWNWMTYMNIPIFSIKLQSTLISRENNWLALNTGKIGYEHKH